jgi:hypothetical protein
MGTWRTSPDTLALTVACRSGCSRTGDREPPRQRLGVDLGEVGGRELETTTSAALPSGWSPNFLSTRVATVPPMAPTITNATAAPNRRRLVHRFAMLTPRVRAVRWDSCRESDWRRGIRSTRPAECSPFGCAETLFQIREGA